MEHGNPAGRGRDTVTRGERAAQATDSVGEATLELFADASAYNDLLWHALRNLCPPQGRVLEVGCGIGNLTTLLLREPAVTGVHAIDPEPKYVDRLRNTLRDPRLDTSGCGVEQFRPEVGSPYRGQEKRMEAVKEREPGDDPEMAGKIAKVVRPGYAYCIDESNHKVVRSAQVKLYG